MDKLFVAIFSIAVVCLVYFDIKQAKEWHKFRIEHKCKIVAHIDGDVFTTFDANGKMATGSTSSKEGWLCDDGITYYK